MSGSGLPVLCLDCTSFETALQSVSHILGWREVELADHLTAFRYEQLPERERRQYSPRELLIRWVTKARSRMPTDHATCWFHVTRVLNDVTFSDGLVPLERERLIETLHKIAMRNGICHRDEWRALVTRGLGGETNQGKPVRSPTTGRDAGPHGFLVKDWILLSPAAQYYFEVPEFIREFCSAVGPAIGEPLCDEYRAESSRTLVKFCSSLPSPCALPSAICYLKEKVHDEELTDQCSCGFDGGGEAVTVLDVERPRRRPA